MSTATFILYIDFLAMCVTVVSTMISALWGKGHSVSFRVNIFIFAIVMLMKAYERTLGAPASIIDLARELCFAIISIHYMKISLEKRRSV